jgi:hypothetical protein
MTRINTIDPKLLPMPWLVAEYRELPRILNRVAEGKPFSAIPESYCMGAGHVSFFGDKLAWLHYRHEQLRAELIQRGSVGLQICTAAAFRTAMAKSLHLCGDWTPKPYDHFINLDRLKASWLKAKRMDPGKLEAWLAEAVRHHQLPNWIRFELIPPPPLNWD